MKELPGFTSKRKILFSPRSTPQDLVRVGKEFLEAEYYDDALEFFTRAGAADEVRAVAEKAYEAADVPLFMRARKAIKESIAPEQWEHLAQANIKLGRFSMAQLAYNQAGMPEKAEQVKSMTASSAPGPQHSE